MNPKDLLALLGSYDTAPPVEEALKHYAVRNRPEVEIDEEDADGPVVETQSWVKNSRAGVEFGFHDEAAWIGLDETEYGKRPMVLTQIYLYGEHDGVRPYRDALPFDLQLFDDRTTVRGKLAALESTRHSHIRDTWDAPSFRMTIAFTENDRVLVSHSSRCESLHSPRCRIQLAQFPSLTGSSPRSVGRSATASSGKRWTP